MHVCGSADVSVPNQDVSQSMWLCTTLGGESNLVNGAWNWGISLNFTVNIPRYYRRLLKTFITWVNNLKIYDTRDDLFHPLKLMILLDGRDYLPIAALFILCMYIYYIFFYVKKNYLASSHGVIIGTSGISSANT